MEPQENIFNELNKEQKRAVTFGDGPVLIVAGAGTGKTTVITRRIAYLISKAKARPEEILGLTFTDKAAGEMEERVDKLLPIGYFDLWLSTFHSFCERVLKNHGLDIGLSTDFKVLDQTAAWLLVRQNLAQFNLSYYRPLGNPSRFLHALLSHFSRCKDQTIYPEDYLRYSQELKSELTDLPESQEKERLKEIAQAYHIYQKLLLGNNVLDFGDLINYCLQLFRKRQGILEHYRRQFKYILVDEFQDTNWAQYELVKLLAAPRNNLTVTADDDQSVYKWRGASYNNVLQFRKDFPQAKEIGLIRNYRSCQNILDLAYKFIQANNPHRLEYLDKINKKLAASKDELGIIEHLHFRTLEGETTGVVNKIIGLLKEDKEACFSDFAILVRANDSASCFVRALERAEIPYFFAASRGLYAKPIILDIISYFKLLDNYHESSAVWRILNLPFFPTPAEELMRITQYAYRKTLSLYESLQHSSLIAGLSQKTLGQINFILALLQKHSAQVRQGNVSEIFVAFLEDSGYLKYLANREKRQEFSLLSQFYDKIKAFEATALEVRLRNFMEQLNMELASGEQGKLAFDVEEGPALVKLMTIHGAKGLEFKYVFLVNLVDKRFPTIERGEPIEIPKELIKEIIPEGDIHLAEERRLCYVAITRAKKGLFFTSARDYGGQRKKKLSQFLIELGFKPAQKIQSREPIRPIRPPTCRGKWGVRPISKEGAELLPSHLSFSQLMAFSNCPLQYKFAHILKVPVRGKGVFSFGKTMHETLHEFVRLAAGRQNFEQNNLFSKTSRLARERVSGICPRPVLGQITFEDLLNTYKQKWIDEWYEDKLQKEEYYKLGKRALKKFYQDFCQNPPEILCLQGLPALEQWFKLKIGDYVVKGRIDRIDKQGEGVELIDYKTGQSKENLTKEEKDQLLIYQLATEEALGLKPVKLTYYYLDEGTKLSFLGSEKEKASEKEKIIFLAEQIKKSDFKPTAGWQCKTCDFKDICEHASR